MRLAEFYLSVSGIDPEIIQRIHCVIVALPISSLKTSGCESSRDWAFTSKEERELAADVLRKRNLDFKFSEPYSL